MKSLAGIIIVVFFVFVNAAVTAESEVLAAHGLKPIAEKVQWVESQTGEVLFDVDDIVRFDWEKQVFELTRQSAMDFMARLSFLGVRGSKFIVKSGMTVIYEGTLVSPVSSIAVGGPVIQSSILPDDLKPPLFRIDGGYPRDFEKNEVRFSERLKKALQQNDVLGEIDLNNPPLPIESTIHGWFGDKEGLRTLIEVFPETFRFGRKFRVYIHLTGAKYLDKDHIVDVSAKVVQQGGEREFTTEEIFSSHGSEWKNVYVLKINPWDEARGSSRRLKGGSTKLSLEVSTRKIVNEETKTYSKPIGHVKTDAIDVKIQPGQSLLDKMPNKAVIRFRKAIKDGDWETAFKYCTAKIKSKAEGYGSAEAFFKDVLPIDEINALSEFQISRGGYSSNEAVSYGCEIRLKDPGYRYSLEWVLLVVKEGQGWAVEFPTKPLKVWVKHEILKLKDANDERQIDPEKSRAGFEVRLVPLTDKFAVGRAMRFRVEMENIRNETLGYMNTSFMAYDPMEVKDPDGAVVPYIGGSVQTCVSPEFVEPGETVVLADKYDVRSQYHITKPGKYSFQFKGCINMGLSNIIEKHIEPGSLSALEQIVEDISAVLPDGWRLTRRTEPAEKVAETSTAKEAVLVDLIGKRTGKVMGNSIFIIVLLDTAADKQAELKDHLSELEYWGKCKWGSLYGISHDVEELWPGYKEELLKALAVGV
ncbi:MAG: hypothetical protein JW912_01930 [Sedimentisphaerales bacterium]|nr:hypothetical protein [Sedimentisphaerales bacterium]